MAEKKGSEVPLSDAYEMLRKSKVEKILFVEEFRPANLKKEQSEQDITVFKDV